MPVHAELKQARYALERAGLRLLAVLLPLVPRRALVALANAAGAVAAVLDRRGRAVALANLECAFGARYSEVERRRILRRSYQNFVLTMSSLFWGLRLKGTTFQRWIEIEGLDQLEIGEASPHGKIFLCIHQGNWEWASLSLGLSGLRGMILAGRFKNESLAEIFAAARAYGGHQMISQDRSMFRLLRQLKRGGTVGLLCDLSFVRERAATVVRAWGLEMVLPVLPAALALSTGAQLVPVLTEPLADGRCRVWVQPPVEIRAGATTQEVAQSCWDRFEGEIEKRPELWLWPYKHFRHRPGTATRDYPFYANRSGAFEKLQRSLCVDQPNPNCS